MGNSMEIAEYCDIFAVLFCNQRVLSIYIHMLGGCFHKTSPHKV